MSARAASAGMDVESAVRTRYAAASRVAEAELCCAVDYPAGYLEAIPQEIIDRDYGCGDPSPYVHPGETVLDLGSGGGKLCYILAQVVGPQGRVIGVDCNEDMLDLSRRHQAEVARRLGYANVDFRYGLIQDLKLDMQRLGAELQRRPVVSPADWLASRSLEETLREEHPLVADESVDCVVSNCVLNLVRPQDRRRLFEEVFRVLRPGGRAAISDIVADRDPPADLRKDPQLWSGCISGAFREDQFLQAFVDAGFHGLQVVRRQSSPWKIVRDIQFRSLTVVAHKGPPAGSSATTRGVMYRGPFLRIEDDLGGVYPRGTRVMVDESTFQRLQQSPYDGQFLSMASPVASELVSLGTGVGCCADGSCG